MPHPEPFDRDIPAAAPLLEEAALGHVRDGAAAFGFAIDRIDPADRRPLLLVTPRRWTLEHGRPFARGIGHRGADGLLLVTPRTDQDGLWAMEQALRSGAVAAAIGMIDGASLTQTRRLDFAAREGGSIALLVRGRDDGLSAARRRWRIGTRPSAANGTIRRRRGRGGWRPICGGGAMVRREPG